MIASEWYQINRVKEFSTKLKHEKYEIWYNPFIPKVSYVTYIKI